MSEGVDGPFVVRTSLMRKLRHRGASPSSLHSKVTLDVSIAAADECECAPAIPIQRGNIEEI